MLLANIWNWRSVRYRLACLVLVCVTPVWLAAGSLVYFAYQDKTRSVDARLLDTAQTLMQAIDQEIDIIEAALGALATSPSLDTGDFSAFHRQAKLFLQAYPESDLLVADATGQQLYNSFRPPGTPLPKRNNSALVRRVFEEGKPVVSDLFRGALTGRALISVDVPVVRDGNILFDLGLTLPTNRIVAIMERYPLPSGWVGLIMDSKRTAVYRTLNPGAFVGKQVPPLFGNPGAGDYVKEFKNLEGISSLACLSRSAESGWSVVVHMPKALVWEQLREWLLWTVAGTVLLSVAGIILAGHIAGGISRSIRALIPPARELAAGNAVAPGAFGLEETDAVGKALAEASLLLMERTANLERSNRELEEFAAVASHDLQEPLRKIKAFGERLRENNAENLDATGHDYLRRMENAVDRMNTLIQDLLEYSRITTRPNPFVATDLGRLAREAASDIETAVKETGGQITIDLMPWAEVDALQMRRAFQNLFSNALKFHGETPPRIMVTSATEARDGREYARIAVTDNGIGFDVQYLEKIFQPFQRLHGRGKFPGTGIGLAIVKKSVERHGGTITAESRPGSGATFFLTIPLRQQPNE
ncbi:sensor histidine kinase [Solidesulfovibrio sp.]|uniref:sensor histidine kinase n=1 Tax=Solidesulfovibrio sp. TaxID=2910990 RepID=UPI002612CDDC|nr:sensor histidine kinase [Solidesulfovibrio sp.]